MGDAAHVHLCCQIRRFGFEPGNRESQRSNIASISTRRLGIVGLKPRPAMRCLIEAKAIYEQCRGGV
jgi:hypothetical protein